MSELDPDTINQALLLLGERLELAKAGPLSLVVCGGAALIACSLVTRSTTRDVDVVALMSADLQLVSPDPLPEELMAEAEHVRRFFDLPEDWLNNGPSKDPGGLFQVGLPSGVQDRLIEKEYGTHLTVFYLGRLDQIHFKVFAAVDGGPGRHVGDLMELKPTSEEIEQAARWAMTHDPSDGFNVMMVSMLKQLGYDDVAERL